MYVKELHEKNGTVVKDVLVSVDKEFEDFFRVENEQGKVVSIRRDEVRFLVQDEEKAKAKAWVLQV